MTKQKVKRYTAAEIEELSHSIGKRLSRELQVNVGSKVMLDPK